VVLGFRVESPARPAGPAPISSTSGPDLQHQRPDLARRAVRAADYRPGESTLAKPFFAVIALLELAEASLAEVRCPTV
jgi:hypothetical protein